MSSAAAASPLRRDAWGRRLAVSLAVLLLLVSCGCRCEGRRCHDEERRALLEIKESINYPNGSALPDWGLAGGEEDCCRWSQIVCSNSTGRVVEINLYGLRWHSEERWYPNFSSFTQFSELERLDLCYNRIGGAFPDALCQLKRLKELGLCVNEFDGVLPPCLCQMQHLEALEFYYSQLQGILPPCLCNIRSLRRLDFSANRFQGNIPSCLGNLRNLQFLILDDNEFEGSIPPSIFPNLTNLQFLSIGGQYLEGTLSFSVFANLSNLAVLKISSHYGVDIETESSSWVPSFQLGELHITGCAVNRRSGNKLPSFLSTQSRLYTLVLQESSISGVIPSWLLCNSSLARLQLGGNMLHGTLHLPCRNASHSLRFTDFSHNHIYGSLPMDIGFLFPNLEDLIIYGNELEGHIPPSLGGPPLSLLDLSDNYLSGKLPQALTKNQTTLRYLNVSHNQLEGDMLPKDSYVPNLGYLCLSHNHFTGSISPSISNFSQLRILDVRQNYLTGDLSQSLPIFSPVSFLLFSENHLEGHLPSHLCQLQNLQLLDLSRNNLSGKIPSCLNNMSFWRSSSHRELTYWRWWYAGYYYPADTIIYFTSKSSSNPYEGKPLNWMTGLDISSNQLHGPIPSEIGELLGLRSLNLSNNFLHGTLPTSVGNMDSLESLDLSHNNLSGTIPPEIVRLHFLSAFSVAFNNLSGMVPYDKQFFTFNESSYEGNPRLCGPPLARNCSINKATDVDPTEDEEHFGILDNDIVFYSFVFVSFGLGFWSFMVALFLKKRWRVKYFKVVDKYYDLYLRRR